MLSFRFVLFISVHFHPDDGAGLHDKENVFRSVVLLVGWSIASALVCQKFQTDPRPGRGPAMGG